MSLPTLFDLCTPRDDVLGGNIQESDFAADLAQVLRGEGPDDYRTPAKFFANTHPTRGLRALLHNVLLRLQGEGGEVASVFRLDTQYGGGKTHALIALSHAANGMVGVGNVSEFVEPALVPKGNVRIAAFDGENADPSNGRPLPGGLRAYTPWGELAFALAGAEGYELVRKSDLDGTAPGADNLRELFGGQPTLILLDELSIYLRKVAGRPGARGQMSAFFTSLFKAVEGTKNACVVFTLAIGSDGKATDAYSSENLIVSEMLSEMESIAARKATLLDPTAADETAQVLRRRLFKHIDDARVPEIVAAYQELWSQHREDLPPQRLNEDRANELLTGYPLHPALMGVLTNKLSTLGTFQRVRGMLRLLARVVGRLWSQKPTGTYAIHPHHVDPGVESIRQELVTRLGMGAYSPAIRSDVSAGDGLAVSLAQQLDVKFYGGLPPYTSCAARTILLHTFAFNDDLKGISLSELRYAVLGPGLDPSFIEDARKKFVTESAYLDDRPNVPMRFLTEANLTQIIRRQQDQVDANLARSELNDRIRQLFGGSTLELVPFPAGPGDVPDDVGSGKPYLVVLHFDAVTIHPDKVAVPLAVEKMFRHRSDSVADFRLLQNNVCFLVVDEAAKDDMRKAVVRRLALGELRLPDRIRELAQHQQDKIQEHFGKSDQQIAVAVQQAYRHLFFPTRNRLEGASVDLGHQVIDKQVSSFSPGNGQLQVVRVLREARKLRTSEDQPDSPSYVRDRTPLKKGQITTASLREEFRRDPAMPMLIGDDIFARGIRDGIGNGDYVYVSGSLMVGKGDPFATIRVDEQSFVYTMEFARAQGIWPRRTEKEPVQTPGGSNAQNTSGGGTSGMEIGGGSSGNGPTGGGSGGGTKGGGSLPLTSSLHAEATLPLALSQLWSQARGRGIVALSIVRLRVFDVQDAFKLLGAIGTVSGPKRTVALDAKYETADGGSFDGQFEGSIDDAKPVKDFLDPQLRAAKDKSLDATFTLAFPDGLALAGDAPERLAERLVKFASGNAYVEAEAKELA